MRNFVVHVRKRDTDEVEKGPGGTSTGRRAPRGGGFRFAAFDSVGSAALEVKDPIWGEPEPFRYLRQRDIPLLNVVAVCISQE